MIFCRRAQEGDAPDVDRLDGFRMAGAGSDRLDEGVEVDDDEVDELHVALSELLQMARIVAAREDAGVHVGVERFDSAVEELVEAGQL